MKVYLAARYSRRQELCGYREKLRSLGMIVTSRWLDGNHQIATDGTPIGDDGESLIEDDSGEASLEAARLRRQFAAEDILDIRSATTLISFTEPPRSGHSRGGRHVELGMALARQEVTVIIVGPRENLFCWLGRVNHFNTWDECVAWLETWPGVKKARRERSRGSQA